MALIDVLARVVAGRLRSVNPKILKTIKSNLRSYDIQTGAWDTPRKRRAGDSAKAVEFTTASLPLAEVEEIPTLTEALTHGDG